MVTHPQRSQLKTAREVRCWSQEDVAAQVGTSAVNVSRWERGVTTPTPYFRAKLCALFEKSAEELGLLAASHATASVGVSLAAPARSFRRPHLPPTPLIGRVIECAALLEMLGSSDVRLVTLTGAGGVGKTHLALHLAPNLRSLFADGVLFLDLSPLRSPEQVAPMLAQRLGVQDRDSESLHEAIIEQIHQREMLLIFDNFEQVSGAAPLLVALLADLPQVKVLVTSRMALQVRAEQTYPLLPLALPDQQALPPLDTLAAIPAVALFVARARAIDPDFTLTAATGATIAEICCRLDGLPLAIELAAARTRVFTLTDILQRLQLRLPFLMAGPHDLPMRQRTLRDTLAWSLDLVPAEVQRLFRQLAVFLGGWTLEAMEQVCVDVPQVHEAMTSLVQIHLVRRKERSEDVLFDVPPRFGMLETVREFSATLLAESGEQEQTSRRHAQYYLQLVEETAPQFSGPDQAEAFEGIECDHENLRAALRWTIAHHETEIALRFAGGLYRFWAVRGYWREGRDWLEQALLLLPHPYPPEWHPWHAKALAGIGLLALRQGDASHSQQALEQSLALQRALDDQAGAAGTLNNLAIIARSQGSHKVAQGYWEESLELRRALHDVRGMGMVLANLATVAYTRGAFAEAAARYEEALQHSRQVGDAGTISLLLNNCGVLEGLRGHFEYAAALTHESLNMARMLGSTLGIALALHTLADLTYQEGHSKQQSQAMVWCAEALELMRPLGDQENTAMMLVTMGLLAYGQGREIEAQQALAEAKVLYHACLGQHISQSDRQGTAEVELQLGRIALAQGDWTEAQQAFYQSLRLFAELTLPVGIATSLDGLGRTAIMNRQAPGWGVRWLIAAELLRQSIEVPRSSVEAVAIDRVLTEARAVLGESEFAAAATEGAHLPLNVLLTPDAQTLGGE